MKIWQHFVILREEFSSFEFLVVCIMNKINRNTSYIFIFGLLMMDLFSLAGVIGLLQSALPYILVSYALKYLPTTLIGVFMVTSAWWSSLFESIPKIKVKRFIFIYVFFLMFCVLL